MLLPLATWENSSELWFASLDEADKFLDSGFAFNTFLADGFKSDFAIQFDIK